MAQAITQWAQNQENLDIYQINAFYVGTGQKRLLCLSFWKTLVCIGLQTAGIMLLIEIKWEEAGLNCGEATYCQSTNLTMNSWMAFFFASFVSVVCGEQLKDLGNYGMYQWGPNQPDFISTIWVAIGLWTNCLVLILCWTCSVLIIYASPNLLEMVLNAVAVLFVITMDDEIVTFSDYVNIQKFMTNYASKNKAEETLEKIGDTMMKLQLLWTKPIICFLLVYPPMVGIPLMVFFCFQEEKDRPDYTTC